MNRTQFAALTVALLLLAGCSAPSGSSSASSSQHSTPTTGVQVDWSRLEQDDPVRQADRDGGRWYAGSMTELIPSEEYGPLIPYVGSIAYSFNSWTDQNGQEQTWYSPWGTSLYGLMTKEGKLVTDPVYLSAVQPSFRWQGQTNYLPVLILSQANEEWKDSNNGRRYCVAALNGSWCTDFEFWLYTTREDELMLAGPNGLTWMDAASGNRIDWDWTFLGISEDEVPQVMEQWMWLVGLEWMDLGVFMGMEDPNDWENTRVRIFQPETLEFSWISMADYNAAHTQWFDQRNKEINRMEWEHEIVGDQFILRSGERSYALTPPIISENMGHGVMGDLAVVHYWDDNESLCWLFRLSTREFLFEGTYIDFIYDHSIENPAPYVSVTEADGTSILYAPDLTPLLIHHLSSPDDWISHTIRDGLVYVQDNKTFFGCYDCHSGTCIFYRNLTLGD